MTRAEIERAVGDGLRSMVLNETAQTNFSFSIVPSKTIVKGGLEVNFNGWRALLVRLRDAHLPQQPPYSNLVIGIMLANATYEKTLRSARYQITERLLLHDRFDG